MYGAPSDFYGCFNFNVIIIVNYLVSSVYLPVYPLHADLELKKMSFNISLMLAFQPASHELSMAARHFCTVPRMPAGSDVPLATSAIAGVPSDGATFPERSTSEEPGCTTRLMYDTFQQCVCAATFIIIGLFFMSTAGRRCLPAISNDLCLVLADFNLRLQIS